MIRKLHLELIDRGSFVWGPNLTLAFRSLCVNPRGVHLRSTRGVKFSLCYSLSVPFHIYIPPLIIHMSTICAPLWLRVSPNYDSGARSLFCHTLSRRLTYTGHIANKTRVTYCFPEHFPCAFTATHPDAQNVTDEPSIYLQGTKVDQFKG